MLPAAAVQAVQLDALPALHVGGGPACSASPAGHVRCWPALQPRSSRPVGHTTPPLSASAILRECVDPRHSPPAVDSLSDDGYLNVLNNTYESMYL